MELVTDENGAAVLHGFRGEYELNCGHGKHTIPVSDTPAEFVWKV